MIPETVSPSDVGAFQAFEFVETGLVTAAVTAPGPEVLTPDGREAMKALVAFAPDITLPQLAAFAREIAQDVYPLDQLLHKYRITNAQYDFLTEHNEFFKNTLLAEIKDWQSVTSTEKRIKLQALAAFEDKLPVIASRMGERAEKLADVVEAAKLVAKIAGVDAAPGGLGLGGERFTISIDLGADTKLIIGPPAAAGEDHVSHPASAPMRDVTGHAAGGGGALQPLRKT